MSKKVRKKVSAREVKKAEQAMWDSINAAVSDSRIPGTVCPYNF